MKHRRNERLGVALLGFCIFITTFSFAQDKHTITLNEAINLSVKNSKQLKGSEARIDEATAALKEAVERRLPDASVSGSYLRLNNPNIDIKSKRADTGTNGTTQSSPKPSQAMYAMANVSLPIYAGYRIKYGIESAKYLEQATKLDADNDREAVIINAIDAFNNLYKAKAAVNLVTENLKGANQRVADFTSLEKNGLMARNDLLKAELQVSNTELALLDAENNWKLANVSMDLLLGLPENTELVPDSASMQIPTSIKTLEEYVQLGMQNRKDLSSISYRRKAAAVGIKATEGEKYPSIALTGGYVALGIPNVLTVTNAVNIGLGVQYNIASLWKNDAKVQQAKARERQVAANEDLLNDAVRLQISQAYQNYLLSQKKIEVYAKSITQATENYRIIKNKYDNSLATATDLLDADVAQLQSKLNYAFAQSDALVAYNKLLQASGMLYTTTSK